MAFSWWKSAFPSSSRRAMSLLRAWGVSFVTITIFLGLLCTFSVRFSSFIEDEFSTPGIYYKRQRSLVLQSARKHPLYWPFAQTTEKVRESYDGLDYSVGADNSRRECQHEFHSKESSFMNNNIVDSKRCKLTVDLHVRDREGYFAMVGLRMRQFVENLEGHRRTDPLIEKDKCLMHEFFKANDIPHCPILHEWRNKDEAKKMLSSTGANKILSNTAANRIVSVADIGTEGKNTEVRKILVRPKTNDIGSRKSSDIQSRKSADIGSQKSNDVGSQRSDDIWSEVSNWPAFLKMCHITQGAYRSVELIQSNQQLNPTRLISYVDRFWNIKADDWLRSWREDGNIITAIAKPGVMMQAAKFTIANDASAEFKIENDALAKFQVGYDALSKVMIGNNVSTKVTSASNSLKRSSIQATPSQESAVPTNSRHETHPIRPISSSATAVLLSANKAYSPILTVTSKNSMQNAKHDDNGTLRKKERERGVGTKHMIATKRLARAMQEVRVEVLWGRAVVAAGGSKGPDCIYLRGNGSIESHGAKADRAANADHTEPHAPDTDHPEVVEPEGDFIVDYSVEAHSSSHSWSRFFDRWLMGHRWLPGFLLDRKCQNMEQHQVPHQGQDTRAGDSNSKDAAGHIEDDEWILTERHFERCVWRVAEHLGRNMMIDQVRVDIFVYAGHPDECVVNEISLSSGYPFFGNYFTYIQKLWIEPHLETSHHLELSARADPHHFKLFSPSDRKAESDRIYSVFGDSDSKPLYALTPLDFATLQSSTNPTIHDKGVQESNSSVIKKAKSRAPPSSPSQSTHATSSLHHQKPSENDDKQAEHGGRQFRVGIVDAVRMPLDNGFEKVLQQLYFNGSDLQHFHTTYDHLRTMYILVISLIWTVFVVIHLLRTSSRNRVDISSGGGSGVPESAE